MGGCPDRDRRHGHARHQAARASRTFAARLYFRLMRRFPAADDFHVALLTRHARGAVGQVQPRPERRRLADSARGQHAQDVAVGHEHDVAVRARDLGDDAVAARADAR